MNRLLCILALICLTSFTNTFAGNPAQGTAVRTVVIDPGHGGMDPGAIGPGGHHESDLALAVSLKFGDMVKKAFPDVKIIYTRTTDKFVSLADRADMANKAKADLFICIHLNSSTSHDAYGTATYVLGLHRTDDNLEVAKRENSVIELEGDRDKNYEFDPNSPEGHIIMSMKQNAFLDQSILIASKIEDQLALLAHRKSHGVKQAGFWVLYKTAMPSLLAEVGFISNPTEEQYLSTDAGQTSIAGSVYKAFRSYKFEIEGKKDTAQADNVISATSEKKTEIQAKDTLLTAQNNTPAALSPQPVETGTAASHETPQTAAPVVTAKAQKQDQVPAIKPEAKQAAPPAEKQPPADTGQQTVKTIEKPQADNNKAPKAQVDTPVSAVAVAQVQPVEKVLGSAADQKSPSVTNADLNGKEKSQPKTTLRYSGENDSKKPAAETRKPDSKKEEAAKMPKTDTRHSGKEVRNSSHTDTAGVTAAPKEHQAVPLPAIAEAGTEAPKTAPAAEKTKPAAAVPVAKDTAKASLPSVIIHEGDEVYFTIQLMAGKNKPANYDDLVNTFGLINKEDVGNGLMRYMAGEYKHYGDALNGLQTAHDKGIRDAFIIAYVNKKRVDSRNTYLLGRKYP